MLELRVKAAAIGIRSADFAQTPIEDIIVGWEAKRLEMMYLARPAIEAQLAKLSPVSLGKSAEEKDKPEDAKYAREGEKIKAQIEETLRFSYMPEFMQAQWVRTNGRLPGQQVSKSKPIEGLAPALALEIIKLSESGSVPDGPLWKYIHGTGPDAGRMRATARQK